MIDSGVPAGASSPIRCKAESLFDGCRQFRRTCETSRAHDSENAQLAGAMKFEHLPAHRRHDHGNLSTHEVGEGRTGAPIRYVGEVRELGSQFERLTGEVVKRPRPGGAVGHLARVGFGIRHEFVEGVRRDLRVDDDGEGRNRHAVLKSLDKLRAVSSYPFLSPQSRSERTPADDR
jgi:hypothetical protein